MNLMMSDEVVICFHFSIFEPLETTPSGFGQISKTL